MAREKGMNLPRTSYGLNTYGGNGIGIGRRDLLPFITFTKYQRDTALLTYHPLLRLTLIPKKRVVGMYRYVGTRRCSILVLPYGRNGINGRSPLEGFPYYSLYGRNGINGLSPLEGKPHKPGTRSDTTTPQRGVLDWRPLCGISGISGIRFLEGINPTPTCSSPAGGRSPPTSRSIATHEEANDSTKELLDMEPKETEWRRSRHEKAGYRAERRTAT
jgi:hypothetical protein